MSGTVNELARAYAILGIRPDTSPEQLKRRYKELVRRWHPDRFVADPQGRAEAELRMREINDAFRQVAASPVVPKSAVGVAPPAAGGRRLSREEIDRMVGGIGTDGPVDWLLGTSMWDWSKVSRPRLAATISYGVAALVALVVVLFGGGDDHRALWLVGGAWVCSFLVLLRVLPKDSGEA